MSVEFRLQIGFFRLGCVLCQACERHHRFKDANFLFFDSQSHLSIFHSTIAFAHLYI